jgi:hypothetical protein
MDNFNQLWSEYETKQPVLKNPDTKLQMPVSKFKEALRLAYLRGANDQSAIDELANKFRKKGNEHDFGSIFDGIFPRK